MISVINRAAESPVLWCIIYVVIVLIAAVLATLLQPGGLI